MSAEEGSLVSYVGRYKPGHIAVARIPYFQPVYGWSA
jgi:hypothetical protein